MEEENKYVVFINAIRPATFKALEKYRLESGVELKPLVLANSEVFDKIYIRNGQNFIDKGVDYVKADFSNTTEVAATIAPYKNNIVSVTAQYENCVHDLAQVVEVFDYLNMPTKNALEIASEKKKVRDMLDDEAPDLNPRYIEISEITDKTIEDIEGRINSYPMIVKPSGLEGSLLVSVVYNQVELKQRIHQVLETIEAAYSTWIKRNEPLILVEEFMVGRMYSIDSYINNAGTFFHCPPVRVHTGYEKGYEDFFGHIQTTPTDLTAVDLRESQIAVERACKKIGLNNITAHVELMLTASGWKIIEIGPRIGGYRHDLYLLSFGINHIVNDILIRAGKTPVIDSNVTGYSAYLKLYPKQEGVLEDIINTDQLSRTKSVVALKQDIFIGERVKFAKNNGDPIFDVVLFSHDHQMLWDDINSLETSISFKVKPDYS